MTGSDRSETLDHQIDQLTLDDAGLPLPPWRVCPWWPTSMGWRMGDGEWYLMHFGVWFERQSTDAQRSYRKRYPTPVYWWTYYIWNDDGAGCVVAVALHLLSLPVTIPAFWWRRLIRPYPEWQRAPDRRDG